VEIHTIDLLFQGKAGLIAAYLLPHSDGAVLIESGPGSTTAALETGLAAHGFSPADVTDLFLTHIHLDHAGAAGWLAGYGARVHVHPRGLPHLANPSRLLASAGQIYGDEMDTLWGTMIPVPSEQLISTNDGDRSSFDDWELLALDTPGHASHHLAYVSGDLCFSGDVGGIRLDGPLHILPPMPPPDFHLETWLASCRRLQSVGLQRIAPTHFGIFPDAQAHLAMLEETLVDFGDWLTGIMPDGDENLEGLVTDWMAQRAESHGLSAVRNAQYEIANPSHTSAWGVRRYWKKYRSESA
jgi:glyoxylase-like metal-dependent hydrolase (beta-lactamase superfamily II)